MRHSQTATWIGRGRAGTARSALLAWSLAFCATGALPGGSLAIAAESGMQAEAMARFQQERARCLSGESQEDRKTCLIEAAAAYEENRHGRLDDRGAPYERNRVLRCDVQPVEDREDCLRRMRGEGVTTGSVAEGAVIRELVRPVVVPDTSPMDRGAGGAR